jgi:hypothetical protein
MSSDNKMTSRKEVDQKKHSHTMIFAGTHVNFCEIVHIYMCADADCGHWSSSTEHNEYQCDMQVTRYSTRVTCYECSKCGRKKQDHS